MSSALTAATVTVCFLDDSVVSLPIPDPACTAEEARVLTVAYLAGGHRGAVLPDTVATLDDSFGLFLLEPDYSLRYLVPDVKILPLRVTHPGSRVVFKQTPWSKRHRGGGGGGGGVEGGDLGGGGGGNNPSHQQVHQTPPRGGGLAAEEEEKSTPNAEAVVGELTGGDDDGDDATVLLWLDFIDAAFHVQHSRYLPHNGGWTLGQLSRLAALKLRAERALATGTDFIPDERIPLDSLGRYFPPSVLPQQRRQLFLHRPPRTGGNTSQAPGNGGRGGYDPADEPRLLELQERCLDQAGAFQGWTFTRAAGMFVKIMSGLPVFNSVFFAGWQIDAHSHRLALPGQTLPGGLAGPSAAQSISGNSAYPVALDPIGAAAATAHGPSGPTRLSHGLPILVAVNALGLHFLREKSATGDAVHPWISFRHRDLCSCVVRGRQLSIRTWSSSGDEGRSQEYHFLSSMSPDILDALQIHRNGKPWARPPVVREKAPTIPDVFLTQARAARAGRGQRDREVVAGRMGGQRGGGGGDGDDEHKKGDMKDGDDGDSSANRGTKRGGDAAATAVNVGYPAREIERDTNNTPTDTAGHWPEDPSSSQQRAHPPEARITFADTNRILELLQAQTDETRQLSAALVEEQEQVATKLLQQQMEWQAAQQALILEEQAKLRDALERQLAALPESISIAAMPSPSSAASESSPSPATRKPRVDASPRLLVTTDITTALPSSPSSRLGGQQRQHKQQQQEQQHPGDSAAGAVVAASLPGFALVPGRNTPSPPTMQSGGIEADTTAAAAAAAASSRMMQEGGPPAEEDLSSDFGSGGRQKPILRGTIDLVVLIQARWRAAIARIKMRKALEHAAAGLLQAVARRFVARCRYGPLITRWRAASRRAREVVGHLDPNDAQTEAQLPAPGFETALDVAKEKEAGKSDTSGSGSGVDGYSDQKDDDDGFVDCPSTDGSTTVHGTISPPSPSSLLALKFQLAEVARKNATLEQAFAENQRILGSSSATGQHSMRSPPEVRRAKWVGVGSGGGP